MSVFRVRPRRRRPLGDHTYGVLLAICNATLGGEPVAFEVAIGRRPERRDWQAAEALVERRLISASTQRVKIRADGARLLGRIP